MEEYTHVKAHSLHVALLFRSGVVHTVIINVFCRSGVGAPVIGDLDGEYRHDSRRNILEWCLPVVDMKNKSGSLEFSIAGQPNDFFPVSVSFVSKTNYCDIQVRMKPAGQFVSLCIYRNGVNYRTACVIGKRSRCHVNPLLN